MSDIADYDTDILLWSERQAELLRGLKARARGLPNDLDVDNLAEEIETLGRSELGAAESYLRLIFIHLVKIVSCPGADPVVHWLAETRTFRSGLAKVATPSMAYRIDLDQIWRRAVHDALEEIIDLGEPTHAFPVDCPFELKALASEEFDPRAAVVRLNASLGETREP